MNGTAVAIVRWPGRSACWNLNRSDGGRLNWRRRMRAIASDSVHCRNDAFGKLPFDFFAKFCIIGVPYSRSSTAIIFRRWMSNATIRRCPQCRRETSWEDNPWKPFCSERCRIIDLGRWASEEYRVPMTETPDDVATNFDREVNSDEQL
jgi:uncharacterized protein